MATKVIMPKLGFDMSSGRVVRWLKKEGDPVRKGEALLEIETDKATVEVQAEADGVLGKILVSEGDVPVGEPVGEIVEAGATTDAPARQATVAVAPKPDEPSEKPYPTRQMPQPPPPTDKTRGQPPPDMQVGVESAKGAPPAAKERIDASPLAKRMAAELGIDLHMVKGSGPNGRITKEDIEAYQATEPKAPTPAIPRERERETAPAPAPTAGEKPLTRMRQAIARRMTESKGPIPQFYLTTDVDIAAGMVLVNQMNAAGKEEELRVSPMTLVIKACALALRKFPNLNASFGGDKIIVHDEINIGVAVAVEGGLLTPVIPHCDQKSVAQIAREVRAAAERARSGRMSREDLTPGTFSVSNLGPWDIDHFIAIINPPEAAILALGTAKEVPVVENSQIKIGVRMKLTLSADHRVTDGAEGARFLQEVKRLLQTPMSLLL